MANNPSSLEALPPLALYPPRKIRSTLPPLEWQACLDTWILCVDVRLRLSDEHFETLKLSHHSSGFPFLLSYLKEVSENYGQRQSDQGVDSNAQLRHRCLLLLRRLLIGTLSPPDCKVIHLYDCLTCACIAFRSSQAWKETLRNLWKRSKFEVAIALNQHKIEFMQHSTQFSEETLVTDLRRASAMSRVLPEAGQQLMVGTDYLEALAIAYERWAARPTLSSQALDILTLLMFTCFRSLMSQNSPITHLLIDHIYMLRTQIDSSKSDKSHSPTLLSSLLVSTSFLRHFEVHLSTSGGKRGQPLLEWLKTYRELTLHLHHRRVVKSQDVKGKDKDRSQGDHEIHIHKAEKLSQVHELFPDLSDRYILQLLDSFSDSVEDVTSALLEPLTLPPHLREGDREGEDEHEEPPDPKIPSNTAKKAAEVSFQSSVSERRNVFDNDDFDQFRISADRLHRGRRQVKDHTETSQEHARSKAAIMSALAAFDADDDERDDTYDVADVGGAVDNTVDTDRRPSTNEEILYNAWTADATMFARDIKTRLSQPRQQLKRETGMTDEQIEGWALMLGRDDQMQNRLKQKYAMAATFGGKQTMLNSTKWRGSPLASDEELSEADAGSSDGRRQGLAGIRGHRNFAGRGSGRGSGTTLGPARSDSTQAARKRKEQGGGRGGANHNRREGRAKKVGRGMAGPAP